MISGLVKIKPSVTRSFSAKLPLMMSHIFEDRTPKPTKWWVSKASCVSKTWPIRHGCHGCLSQEQHNLLMRASNRPSEGLSLWSLLEPLVASPSGAKQLRRWLQQPSTSEALKLLKFPEISSVVGICWIMLEYVGRPRNSCLMLWVHSRSTSHFLLEINYVNEDDSRRFVLKNWITDIHCTSWDNLTRCLVHSDTTQKWKELNGCDGIFIFSSFFFSNQAFGRSWPVFLVFLRLTFHDLLSPQLWDIQWNAGGTKRVNIVKPSIVAIWWFPKIGVPPVIIHTSGFPWNKPSINWGYPQCRRCPH